MKKLVSRSLLLVFAYTLLVFLDGCWFGCRCPQAQPFYDFGSAQLISSVYLQGQYRQIELQVEGGNYSFSDCTPQPTGGLGLATAYACSCLEPGMEGLRFPITTVNVYSLQDYNDSLTAGMPLNSIMSYSPLGGEENELNQDTLQSEYFLHLAMYTLADPTSTPQNFWVEMIKSNGETVLTDTVMVNF